MKDLVIIVLGTALLLATLWPRHGLVARWRRARQLAGRTRQEDALKHILKAEVNGRSPSVVSVAGALRIDENEAAALLAELERGGLLSYGGGAPRLRPAGRELAQHVIRAHRLWESFLADQTGVAETEWHRQAERQEHLLTPEETNLLAARLGHPLRDPHGDLIPAGGEEVRADAGQPLTDIAVGEAFEIVHLEDEPDAVYRQLLDLGLHPGLRARVEHRSDEHLDVRLGDERLVRLNTVQANNVAVSPLTEAGPVLGSALSDLPVGRTARVLGLAPACIGAARRRLLDLGFVPGTEVSVDLVSPAGDPTAYRVRGAVIALRRRQAELIRIDPNEKAVA